MKKNRMLLALGLSVAVLLAGGIFMLGTRSSQESILSQYYCPMHPTYISNQPGDCPICMMKLVKAESAGAQTGEHAGHAPASSGQTASALGTICYLHNCAKAHDGKPCPMTMVAEPGEIVTCPICGEHVAEAAEMPQASTILYWTDPMMPGYKAEGPGKSPMGMDLVPVYAEEHPVSEGDAPAGRALVTLTPKKQQMIGVKAAPASRRRITKTIRTAGRIAYDPELYQAQEEYLRASGAQQRAQAGGISEVAEQAGSLVTSSRMRLRLLGMSDALVDELSDRQGPDLRLLGSDPDGSVWLYASIFEYELPLVKTGQQVNVEIPGFSGRILTGLILGIDPVLNPNTRSARIRAVLKDPDRLLKPEMYVNAIIQIDLGEVLAVPSQAVFDSGTQKLVFVDKGQGVFEPREVQVGATAGGDMQILSGIVEGERVVTSGNFLMDSESRLRGVLEGAGGSHQHGP